MKNKKERMAKQSWLEKKRNKHEKSQKFAVG